MSAYILVSASCIHVYLAHAVLIQIHSFSESLETAPEHCAPFHIWFQVECNVDPALPDDTMALSCPTLSFSAVKLSVTNPHSYLWKLQVGNA